MIVYLKNNDIDRERWDDTVIHSPVGLPYAMSWYLDHMAPDWDALLTDDYQNLFPLPYASRFGIKYVFTPLWIQQLGMFSLQDDPLPGLDDFLNALPAHFRYLDLNLNSSGWDPSLEYATSPQVNLILELDRSYESIKEEYHSKTKSDIKRSFQGSLSLDEKITPEELVALFFENKGKTIKGWGSRERASMCKFMHFILSTGRGLIIGAQEKNKGYCAGAFFIYHEDRIIWMFSGADISSRENRAMFRIIDEVIRRHAGTRDIFDFEGSNDRDLARFYRRFGARETIYYNLRINRLPWILRWMKR